MNLRKPLHLGLGFAFCITFTALPACGDAGNGETTAGPTTAATDTATATGTATGTATEGTATVSSEPTTSGGSVGQTDSGASTGPGTSATGSTSDASSSASTGPGTAESSGGGETGGSTTGGGGDFIPCETDKDCVLADGCCDCDPININQTPPVCNIPECLLTTCAGHGLEGAAVECRFGRCTFAKVQCNPLGVNCKKAKPDCPKGQVAEVEETNGGKCWTGYCVPAEACDWVPDCTYCDNEELVCVGKLQKGAYHLCEPKPAECDGQTDIDCTCGQQICDASPPHTVCHDAQPDIDCECPFC
ncbi:hypothetical protein [Nannocystis sp.]|uniref:hypothetical protein n=1 Tax=Nannocystis sp. TaxID=1962667 RepID=UPI0024228407|nr:hypothetical protein [Nannocystis sp.]MBK7830395.1 hypothetical protein [Nannocystis sp.]MBK9752366.1 hypothetical protein [Nannocystis sp.]